MRRKVAPVHRGTGWWSLLFLLPGLTLLCVFSLYPFFRTLYLSFNSSGPFGGFEWVGAANYDELIGDPEFWRTLKNSAIFCLVMLLGIPLSLFFAALIGAPGRRFARFYQVIYFLPVITMPTAAALVWKSLYNGDHGLINTFLGLFGVGGRFWLSNESTSIYAIAAVGIWMNLGTTIIIFMAALAGVPRDLHEAAMLDGAGVAQRFRFVTVPAISPTIFFVVVMNVIGGLQVFDLLYVLSDKSNPAYASTRTIVAYFYEQAFLLNRQGYAAAVAFVLFFIIAGLTALQFLAQKKWVTYG